MRRLILQYDGLKYNTAYTLNVSGFLDIAGNPMTVYPGREFTTVKGADNNIFYSGGGGGGGSVNTVSAPKNNHTVAGDRIRLPPPALIYNGCPIPAMT